MAKAIRRRSRDSGRSKRQTASIPTYRKILYATIIVSGFFVCLETGLRVFNLSGPPILGKLRFGYDTGIPVFDSDGIETEGVIYQDMPLFEADVELFWKPIPNTPFTGPRGFRSPEPIDETSTENLRILVLGDSCSFLGQTPYPGRLSSIIEKKIGRRCDVFNASCPGYSSQQGLLRLQQSLPLKPHFIIVYFGWNDHWLSLNGCTDRELIERRNVTQSANSILSRFRIYWLVHSFIRRDKGVESTNAPMRVPIADYIENLTSIYEKAQQQDCHVIYATAPSGFESAMPVWALDFFQQYYRMTPQQVMDIPKTHAKFNDAVRSLLAAHSRRSVCDLEKAFQNDRGLFRSDNIHLTEAGHEKVSEIVASTIINILEGIETSSLEPK
jgi:lysophospholipase L1-like esterase